MKRSSGEVQSMVTKAAIGAGLPLGHAEDIGIAAGYLCRTDPAGLTELPLMFAAPHSPLDLQDNILDPTHVAHAGPSIIDWVSGTRNALTLRNIDAPQLLAALVACANHHPKGPLRLRQNGRDIVLEPGPAAPPSANTTTQPDIDPGLWDALNRLAARTYVPSTDESRATGAGAGLQDAD